MNKRMNLRLGLSRHNRFDNSGFARSEVDRYSTTNGDIVFIFDGLRHRMM